jgi:hypothetical protein
MLKMRLRDLMQFAKLISEWIMAGAPWAASQTITGYMDCGAAL